MNTLKKKIAGIVLSMAAVATMAIPTVYAGVDNNISYSFLIRGSVENAQVNEGRNRETSNPDDRWKVSLETSAEGKGTITKFWLENYTGKNVSNAYNVQQGKGPVYRPSKTSGCKTYVWLTAENNNTSAKQYQVTGYWDEETGVFENIG